MARFNIHHAFGATIRDGGFTHWNYNPSGDRDSGYVVGNNNTSLVIDTSYSTEDRYLSNDNIPNINAWVNSVGSLSDGIGLWLDGNDLYIDAVTYFPTLALPSAIELAINNKELSIYCLHRAACIDINPRSVNLALGEWLFNGEPSGTEGPVMLRLMRGYVAEYFNSL